MLTRMKGELAVLPDSWKRDQLFRRVVTRASPAPREAQRSQKQHAQPSKGAFHKKTTDLLRCQSLRCLRTAARILTRKICFSVEIIPQSTESMVRRLSIRRKSAKPQNHVDMRLGDGWHRRNFLSEVIIPSLFTRRHGTQDQAGFPRARLPASSASLGSGTRPF